MSYFFLSLPSHFSDPQLRSFHTLQMHILKEITAHIRQKQNCVDITCGGAGGEGTQSSASGGTRCRLPEPSVEITGDMSKWDRVETRRVGQVVNTLQLHALH